MHIIIIIIIIVVIVYILQLKFTTATCFDPLQVIKP